LLPPTHCAGAPLPTCLFSPHACSSCPPCFLAVILVGPRSLSIAVHCCPSLPITCTPRPTHHSLTRFHSQPINHCAPNCPSLSAPIRWSLLPCYPIPHLPNHNSTFRPRPPNTRYRHNEVDRYLPIPNPQSLHLLSHPLHLLHTPALLPHIVSIFRRPVVCAHLRHEPLGP
jgi:hypothetical protein